MNPAALQAAGGTRCWSGWAVAAAIHAAMLLALASAFTPARPARPAPVSISARLVPAAARPATTPAPLEIALPRSATLVPPVADLPPPVVEIAVAPPVAVAATPPRFDPPAAAATAAIDATNAAARPMTVAAVAVTSPAPVPAPSPMALPLELPAELPADHRLCSERQTARHYPAMLRERGIQGLVRLRVKVDADGRAAEVVVSGGSGWRLLDEAARRVAASCPYIPARRGDQRLVSWVEYPVRFALQPSTLQ